MLLVYLLERLLILLGLGLRNGDTTGLDLGLVRRGHDELTENGHANTRIAHSNLVHE